MSTHDRTTRGKTQPARLRLVDVWLSDWLSRCESPPEAIVDLGPGERGWTTLEMVKSVRAVGIDAPCFAVENDARRCELLCRDLGEAATVVHAGFDFELEHRPGVIRAMNVFRQYPIDGAETAYLALRDRLAPSGVLIVGTTDKTGSVGTFWAIESTRRRLVTFTSGDRGFAPIQFRDFLPRNIRRAEPGANPFFELLEPWEVAWKATRTGEPLADFDASIRAVGMPLARLVSTGIAEWVLEP